MGVLVNVAVGMVEDVLLVVDVEVLAGVEHALSVVVSWVLLVGVPRAKHFVEDSCAPFTISS